ncbi:response regulator [Patescibacteria group bacterium]|nr:response regulator [Patescibacteria group bacterium]
MKVLDWFRSDRPDGPIVKVLVFTDDKNLIAILKRQMSAFSVAFATNGFNPGSYVENFHPDCIIVDFSLGCAVANRICINLCNSGLRANLIALLPCDLENAMTYVASKTFKKPFYAFLLVRYVRRLAKRKRLVQHERRAA